MSDAPLSLPADSPWLRRGRAVVQWLLGDVPELVREPESGALAVVVCTAAAVAMWLGTRQELKGPPVPMGAWRMLVHGGVPLIAVAGWEVRVLWRRGLRPSAAFFATAVGVALLVLPVLLRFSHEGAKELQAEPMLRMVLPAAVGATLVVAGLKAAGARLADWGIGLGDWRWWLPHHGMLLLALLPAVALTTCLVPPLAAYYPMYKPAQTDFHELWTSVGSLGLDLFGWEFLFRGFLVFGIARRGDALTAILLQAIPFFLLHSPKPEAEMISSYIGAIFAGWFCLRARAFLPLYVIHTAIIATVSFTAYWLRT